MLESFRRKGGRRQTSAWPDVPENFPTVIQGTRPVPEVRRIGLGERRPKNEADGKMIAGTGIIRLPAVNRETDNYE